jgi:general secretion pathway protein M
MSTVAPRDRWLALGLLALALLLAWSVLIGPLLEARRTQARALQHLHLQLAQYEATTREQRAHAARLEALQGDPALAGYFLPRQTPAVASASLQQSVRQLVSATDGQLVSIQVVTAPADTVPLPIRLRVQLRGSSATTRQLFEALEGTAPLLIVEELSIQRLAASRTLATPGGEHLDIRFQLVGFLGGEP